MRYIISLILLSGCGTYDITGVYLVEATVIYNECAGPSAGEVIEIDWIVSTTEDENYYMFESDDGSAVFVSSDGSEFKFHTELGMIGCLAEWDYIAVLNFYDNRMQGVMTATISECGLICSASWEIYGAK